MMPKYIHAALSGASILIIAGVSAPDFAQAESMQVDHTDSQVEFKHDIALTGGVNNQIDKYVYGVADIDASLGRTWQNGFGLKINAKGEYKYYGKGNKDNEYDKKPLYLEGITPYGILYVGGIKKKGASEIFYKDLSGMAIDVVGYKRKYNSLSWKGKIGDFGYAISTRDLSNHDHRDISYGARYQANGWLFAAGYDQKSNKQKEALGMSVQYKHKLDNATNKYTLSAIRAYQAKSHSVGVKVESKLNNGLTLGAHYAFNHAPKRHDGYGGFVKYRQDNWAAKGKWEYSEKGYWKGKIDGEITLADFAPRGTTFYGGYEYKEGKPEDSGFHAAAMFGVHKNVKLGLSYSELNEAGEYDFLKGTSLFFRAEL